MKTISTVFLLAFGSISVQAGTLAFETIDMKALNLGNGSISGIGNVTSGAFPYGSPVSLNGVPFIITADNGQVWNAYWATGGNGSGDVTVTFPIVANDVYGFYTVANTYWGGGRNVHQIPFQFRG